MGKMRNRKGKPEGRTGGQEDKYLNVYRTIELNSA